MTVAKAYEKWKIGIRREWKLAFIATFLIGLMVHLPMMLSDIPNHDGLDSLYFDQNMITSGRWFLMITCGFSSYFSLPWAISLLGLVFLGISAALLVELFELKKDWAIVAVAGLLVTFPALASTFAYVFTLDGYMMAMLLAIAAVLFTKKYKLGFLPGALCLAFSMGIYQAYLPFAMILSVFALLWLYMEKRELGEKCIKTLHYLLMGIIGATLYYVILRILLLIQHKTLADYQGISEMTSAAGTQGSFFGTIAGMYREFIAFALKGNILWNNVISAVFCFALMFALLTVFVILTIRRKWWKSPAFFAIILGVVLVLPLCTNVILLISPSVNYHLLMKYQWVLYLIGAVAVVGRFAEESRVENVMEWVCVFSAFGLIFFYGITDNIAYSNLAKKYEKTYAYCERLLDRIEQTPGYYQGIPIAMIGVVGDEQFPQTDYTLNVTSNMIGMNGDLLLYTGPNYRKFIQNYLGATLNILEADAMAEMYYDERYVEMESFPGKDSIRIMDGIMYIKTENFNR